MEICCFGLLWRPLHEINDQSNYVTNEKYLKLDSVTILCNKLLAIQQILREQSKATLLQPNVAKLREKKRREEKRREEKRREEKRRELKQREPANPPPGLFLLINWDQFRNGSAGSTLFQNIL